MDPNILIAKYEGIVKNMNCQFLGFFRLISLESVTIKRQFLSGLKEWITSYIRMVIFILGILSD